MTVFLLPFASDVTPSDSGDSSQFNNKICSHMAVAYLRAFPVKRLRNCTIIGYFAFMSYNTN